MAFSLSDYQIAALQEMQIPVWQLQSELADKAVESPVHEEKGKAKPVSQDTARSHLQRLKDSVSAKSVAPEKADEQVKLQEVSAQQAPEFFADLLVAMQSLAIETIPPVKIGAPIAVSKAAIILPVEPGKLTHLQKKQLWQALCAIT